MKSKKIVSALLFSSVLLGGMVACNDKPDSPVGTFSYTIALESGKNALEVGETDNIIVSTSGIDDANRTYSANVNKEGIISITQKNNTTFEIKALTEGTVIVAVKEKNTATNQKITITINSSSEPANGGFNFASLSGAEAIAKRTEILGKLEKYAIDSHLTGITLFENGGYAKYSSRLDIPTEEYITGYGFGILSEGDILDDLAGETTEAYKRYYHSAQTQNPQKINQMSDNGSQVSDLAGYITSTYWGTKMNSDKNGYEWYPILAKDTVNGKKNTRPIPVYEDGKENKLGLYKKWRIYVKTGTDGLKYRTNGAFKNETLDGVKWDGRPVALKDYEFSLKMLLTGVNQLSRGSELAADKTYGIKGGQRYYNLTSDASLEQSEIDTIWDSMKGSELGVNTGTDSNGSYIEFELVNEIDSFTAMYTLSSSLYSPLPEEFVKMLGNGQVKEGAKIYGCYKEKFNGTSTNLSPNDTTLSLGAYYLENFEDMSIVFKQDENWIERKTYPDRYKIKGIKIITCKDAAEDPDALYRQFYNDELDSCGVPTSHVTEEKSPSKKTKNNKNTRTLVTKGDSTFKLNVNSCTQERWDYLFGSSGKICQQSDKYEVKPWMSNDNFLKGLYWSIDRKTFAENRGAQPSIDFFSNSYLDDPENGHSYNSSDAHKAAVKDYHGTNENGEDNYGYNKSLAVSYFQKAYQELLKTGAVKENDTIHISINWMYLTDVNEYGNEIAKYFTDAFNDPKVSNGKCTLVVDQPKPSSDWQAVYNEVMMKGRFDLAFGAISGNTYNPLNFLEVLKSDNSSGFTLNWGVDTSIVDTKNPLVYNGKKFAFDALWQVADHGGVVENGKAVNSIKQCYLGTPTGSNGKETNDLFNGFTVKIPLEFVDVQDVDLDVSKVDLYVAKGNTHELAYTYDKTNKEISVSIDATLASSIETEIKTAQKKTDPNKDGYIEHPFTRTYYGSFWTIELTYTLSIAKGTPSANTVTVAMTKDAQNYK